MHVMGTVRSSTYH